MRLLVTGGLGFIGSEVVRQAVRTGHEVVNVDVQTYAGDPRTVVEVAAASGYRLERIDISDGEQVTRVFNETAPEAVLHLAAESHVDRSIDRPMAFVETNVMGTAVLLSAAVEHWRGLSSGMRRRFRFVHVSSDEVFGSLGPTDPPFAPTSRYRPRSPYAASKAASDHLARAWRHTYGLPTVITNCSNNYGPFQFPEKLVPLMTINALLRKPLPVYGTGENVRDWLHVADHVRGLLDVVERGQPGTTYLFGGSAERTNLQVVEAVADLVDRLAPDDGPSRRTLIRMVADRPGHDHRYAIDYSATTDQLGWRPFRSFEDGLASTVQWYLDRRDFWEPLLD